MPSDKRETRTWLCRLLLAMTLALPCVACARDIEATPTAMPCTETVLQETQTEIVLDLVQVLNDESDSVRYDAMQQLLAAQTWIEEDTVEGTATITALIRVLEKEDLYAMRSNAVWVLGAIDTTGDRAIGPLIHALQEDSEGAVRIAAGRTLIRYISQPPVLPALTSAFESDRTVRWAIAERLGMPAAPEAISVVPSLIRVLQGEEEEIVRSAIVRALIQLTGQNFQDSARWQQWLQDQPPAAFVPSLPADPSLPLIHSDVLPDDFGTLVLPGGDGTLWLFVGGEAPRVLARGDLPEVSPNGCTVLFRRLYPFTHPQPWMIDVDKGTLRRVFSDTRPAIYGLAWSPDSRGFAMTTGGYGKRSYSGNLWWIDLVYSCATKIAERGGGEPAFSPDGEWIATFTLEIGYTHGTVGLWRTSDMQGELLFAPSVVEQYGQYADLVSERTVFKELVWPADITWADDSTGFLVHMSHADDSGTRLWWVPVDGSAIEPQSFLSPTPPDPGHAPQINATYYVSSTTESGYTEFLYCRHDGPCHSLARLEGEIWRSSYTDRRCER